MIYTPENGDATSMRVYEFKTGGGVALAMYNTDESIRDFAHSSFQVRRFTFIY